MNGTEMSRPGPLWPAIALGLILLFASEAALTEQPPAERRGLRFVRVHCAQCHGIDQDSESPLTNAPPFRTLRLIFALHADSWLTVASEQSSILRNISGLIPLSR
jgi:hypothetical protein